MSCTRPVCYDTRRNRKENRKYGSRKEAQIRNVNGRSNKKDEETLGKEYNKSYNSFGGTTFSMNTRKTLNINRETLIKSKYYTIEI